MFSKLSTAVKGIVTEIGGNVSAAGGKKTKTTAKNTAPDPPKTTPDPPKTTPDPVPAPIPSKAGGTYSGATAEAGLSFLGGGLIGSSIGGASTGGNDSTGTNGNSNVDNTPQNSNGDETDPNAPFLLISGIVLLYLILKILKGRNYFLQNLIFIGVIMFIYLYFYEDTSTTNQ